MNLTAIAVEFNGVIHAIGLPHTSLNDSPDAIVGCGGILIYQKKNFAFLIARNPLKCCIFTFHFIDLAPQKRVGVNVDGAHVLLILMKGGHEAAKVFT